MSFVYRRPPTQRVIRRFIFSAVGIVSVVGVVAGGLEVSGTLSLKTPIVGVVAGALDVTGTTHVDTPIDGPVVGALDVTGTTHINIPIDGVVSLGLDVTGTLGVLEGTVVGALDVTGTASIAWQVGDRWIVGGSATGAWSGQDNDIAEIASLGPTVWTFTTPKAGYTLYIKDENAHYKWNGSAWTTI